MSSKYFLLKYKAQELEERVDTILYEKDDMLNRNYRIGSCRRIN